MKKRGQAAAFIILGLIILIVVLGFISIKSGFFKNLFEGITTEQRNIPQQLKPLQDYLDSCVSEVTKESVNIIALQGGYLEIPSDPMPTTPFTPLGPTLEIIQNSGFRTSVWFREKGNGIQEVNAPSKPTVEKEIAKYVERNFAKCVNNLTQFDSQGYLTSANGIPKAQVTLEDKKITTTVTFPIKVKIASINFTLSEHTGETTSNLGVLYRMAKEIIDKENKEYFLENKTIDMLVAYDAEVPFSGSDFSCTETIWLKSDVERKLKNIIFENVAAIRIKGTNYELQDDKFEYLEFDALETTDKDLTANLMYLPSWPTVIEINPSQGNVLKSDQVIQKAGGAVAAIASTFFCVNQHRFVYDIKYPILVTLRDPTGLIFQFATEVIIDNNQPRVNRMEVLDLPDTESPICQYKQRPVSIFTGAIDSENNLVPLNNVSLSFKCFPAACPLGDSKLNPNGEPVLNTVVPLCFNGVVEGYKQGYKQVQKTIYSSNDPEAPETVLVQLEKIYTKPVNVFVIEKDTNKVREPYDSEQINFQFTSQDSNYQTTYFYSSTEGNNIELLPGTYTINSYILRNSSNYKITIPKQKIETCIDTKSLGLFALFNNQKKCQTTETEAMEFDTILTGGVTGAEAVFARQDLASDVPLNLYILSSQIPGNVEDLQRIQMEIETNKDHPLYQEPKIE